MQPRGSDASGRSAAVIVAAGRGERIGEPVPKQFLDLGGRPLLAWSVEAHAGHPGIFEVVVVLPPERVVDPPDWLPAGATVVSGGATRAASVRAGLKALATDPDTVLVHDGARPFVSRDLISRVIEGARSGPVIPVIPVDDTVKRIGADGVIVETLSRDALRRAQTPQGFPIAALRRAHAHAVEMRGDPRDEAAGSTDDAVLCERLGIAVSTIDGDPDNLKITTPVDLAHARWLVETGLIPQRT